MRKLLIGVLLLGTTVVSAAHGGAVPYDRMPNAEQKAAIDYMITTLGNAGVFSLAGKRSKLKAEGDKTAGLHPLRVFLFIFQNPRLRADLKRMRGRKIVWKNFMHGQPDGWDNTFNAQANLGNMKEAYVDNYAEQLGIAPGPLWAEIEKRNWTGFIDTTFRELSQKSQGGGQRGNGRQPARAQQRASRR